VFHQFIYSHYLDKKYQAPLAEHFALQDGFVVSAVVIGLALIPAIRLPEQRAARMKENSTART
jgi:DHA2 family multidrug resistance protein